MRRKSNKRGERGEGRRKCSRMRRRMRMNEKHIKRGDGVKKVVWRKKKRSKRRKEEEGRGGEEENKGRRGGE